MPSTRCWERAWEETSMATATPPPSRWRARASCSTGASGVVRAPLKVPSTAVGHPWASRTAPTRWVTVVLPLVPVTPTMRRSAAGWPWRAAEARAGGYPGLDDGKGQPPLTEEGHRPGSHRRRSQVVPVEARPGKAAVQRPGTDSPSVEGDRGDVHRGGIADHLQRSHLLQQPVESDGDLPPLGTG